MIAKLVTAYGKPTLLACDAQCGLAWGIHNRPRVRFDDEDDYAFHSDVEALAYAGPAPEDPGTYEGSDGKPVGDEDRLNRWCFRECERSVSTSDHGFIQLKDWSRPIYNQPWKHK